MDEQELSPAESSDARTGPAPEGPDQTDPQGIASASRSCLVILALGVVIILLICVSTAIRLIWG